MRTDRPGNAPPASLRLFFALWPTAADQQAMGRASAAAVAMSGGRAIPGGNLHVTLAFLGGVERARLEPLRVLGRELALGGPPSVSLLFESLQYWRRPQILCATAHTVAVDTCGAAALAARIRAAAGAAGFSPDLKPFHAHVTVARKVAHAPEEQALPMAVRWNCASFALVMSTTGRAGSVYSVVETFPLDGSENAHK